MKWPPVVEVIWEDSATGGDRWMSHEECREFARSGPVKVRSVGLLYRETKRAVTLCLSIHDGQAMLPLSIPRGCIRKMRRLK